MSQQVEEKLERSAGSDAFEAIEAIEAFDGFDAFEGGNGREGKVGLSSKGLDSWETTFGNFGASSSCVETSPSSLSSSFASNIQTLPLDISKSKTRLTYN